MKILLVADSFPPMNSSSAIQLQDLVTEFASQGHHLSVIFPTASVNKKFQILNFDSFSLMKVRIPNFRELGLFKRALTELSLSIILMHRFKRSIWSTANFDGIIFYSPSIFFGPFVFYLKLKLGCKSYLILRDIFPDWALDLGLIKRNIIYYIFKGFELFQYSVANKIGIQTPGNRKYFESRPRLFKKVEVLCNWLTPVAMIEDSINLGSKLNVFSERKIFVYAGNIGPAQNVTEIVDIATKLNQFEDIGFLIIGRGSLKNKVKELINTRNLKNLLLLDEVDSSYIPLIYSKCYCGIVSLDPRHKSHNIPGKFVSYMHYGLPVFAMLNLGNDLEEIVKTNEVGFASSEHDKDFLAKNLYKLSRLDDHEYNKLSSNCKKLAKEMFSSESVVRQISDALR